MRMRPFTLVSRTIRSSSSVDSTNGFASRLLTHGHKVPEGTVILAESQNAGRGRLGRSWHSEREAGLYFSMILFPKAPPSLAPLFTLATAVAMHNAVERYSGLDIDIKWPNDLLIHGKKFCGILSEMQADPANQAGELASLRRMADKIGRLIDHQQLAIFVYRFEKLYPHLVIRLRQSILTL